MLLLHFMTRNHSFWCVSSISGFTWTGLLEIRERECCELLSWTVWPGKACSGEVGACCPLGRVRRGLLWILQQEKSHHWCLSKALTSGGNQHAWLPADRHVTQERAVWGFCYSPDLAEQGKKMQLEIRLWVYIFWGWKLLRGGESPLALSPCILESILIVPCYTHVESICIRLDLEFGLWELAV